ncbi:MAG: nucleoside triphosphate pyrophosphatase [Anaerolineaceae bacterium]|nr:nucleoside triphosphate pyrophosphatase [Anaerolineaceae bacterium]
MNSKSVFVLASGSPRRKELLVLLGLPFEVKSSNINELALPGEAPVDYVTRMAAEKGKASALAGDAWVISADTIVEIDGKIIGKPVDLAQAKKTLVLLCGREHQVYTAIRLSKGLRSVPTLAQSRVSMRHYTEEEIEAYFRASSPLDKAGSYAIQDSCFHPALGLQGCYANVMGLPLCHLYKLLQAEALQPQPGIAQRCQDFLGISCPVYSEILKEA